MTIWMLWSLLFTTLIALSAVAAERIAAHYAWPRRFIWMAAIAVCAVVPMLLATRATHPAPASGVSVKSAPDAAATGIERVVSPSPIARSVERAAVANAGLDTWAIRAWLVMSAVVFGVFAYATVALRRQQAGWHEADLILCRALVAADVGPAVVGFLRPRVVVPQWTLTADEPTRGMILRHELEHLRARDPQVLLASGIVLIALPWNLAMWWIVRRLRVAMEIDCDARVVNSSGRTYEYGKVLLAVGEGHTKSLPLAASLMGRRPLLERRIYAMTMKRPRYPLMASLPFAAFAFVAITAATRAPHPTPLSAISFARGPQPYPTPEAIESMILANLPGLATSTDKSNYAVLVLDANNNFVMVTAGYGSVMLQVWGDPLDNAGRRLRAAERTGVPEDTRAPGGGGRSGGGAGGGGTGGGDAVGAIVTRRSEFQGQLSFARPRDGNQNATAAGARPVNAYTAGMTLMVGTDPATGTPLMTPMNSAPGLHSLQSGVADDSAIDGIPASNLTSLESYRFTTGPLGRRAMKVMVVTTSASVRSQ